MKKFTELEEVRRIRHELKEFIESYGVVSVAVGIVMGQAVAKVISVIVEGLVMPILELLLPGKRWQEAVLSLGQAQIKVGLIIAAFLDFFAVTLVVFFVVRYILKVEAKKDKEN